MPFFLPPLPRSGGHAAHTLLGAALLAFALGAPAADRTLSRLELPGLERSGKPVRYSERNLAEYLGDQAERYRQYRATALLTGDFHYGGKDRRLAVEVVTFRGAADAAAFFQDTRARALRDEGIPVDVGAAGLLDARRQKRNLYFYQGDQVAKVIYAGKGEAPDLEPVARALAEALPKPKTTFVPGGKDVLAVEGVAHEGADWTPGYTLNCDFLPPGARAKAYGAGSEEARAYVIAAGGASAASRAMDGLEEYLSGGLDHRAWKEGRRRWVRGEIRQWGRAVACQTGAYLVIVTRAGSYAEAEPLARAMAERAEGAPPGEAPPATRRSWNPFKRGG